MGKRICLADIPFANIMTNETVVMVYSDGEEIELRVVGTECHPDQAGRLDIVTLEKREPNGDLVYIHLIHSMIRNVFLTMEEEGEDASVEEPETLVVPYSQLKVFTKAAKRAGKVPVVFMKLSNGTPYAMIGGDEEGVAEAKKMFTSPKLEVTISYSDLKLIKDEAKFHRKTDILFYKEGDVFMVEFLEDHSVWEL